MSQAHQKKVTHGGAWAPITSAIMDGLSEREVRSTGLSRRLFDDSLVRTGLSFEEAQQSVRDSLFRSLSGHTYLIQGSTSALVPLYLGGRHTRSVVELRRFADNGAFVALCLKPECEGRRTLADFACLGDDDQLLNDLAALSQIAEEEDWGGEEPDAPLERYGFLMSYLGSTFRKLDREGMVAYATDGSLAAFNTGLLTRDTHAEIYAAFRPAPEGGPRWRLSSFCRADRPFESKDGLDLAKRLGGRMRRARYFRCLGDAVYDATRPAPQLAGRHVVDRGLGLFPADYLAACLDIPVTSASRLREEALAGCRDGSRSVLDRLVAGYSDIRPGTVRRRIETDLRGALLKAHARAKSSLAVAVPAYDADLDETGFVLPLVLTGSQEADLAAMVRDTGDGYEAVALVDLNEARQRTRVVMGRHEPWLHRGTAPQIALGERGQVSWEAAAPRPDDAPGTRAVLRVEGLDHALGEGATVGRPRRRTQLPDIELPATEGYRYASHDQGAFWLRNGAWTFTNHGRNGTRVLRRGTWMVVDGPFALKSGDELEFGNACAVDVGHALSRAVFLVA